MTPHDDMSVTSSDFAPGETMSRFRRTIAAMGMTVFAEIDFSADAANVGLKLESTVLLVFGNPRVGTLLLRENPSVGIDLPLKALAWTADSRHWFAYNLPSLLVRRHDIRQRGVIEKMSQALETAANVAVIDRSEHSSKKETT